MCNRWYINLPCVAVSVLKKFLVLHCSLLRFIDTSIYILSHSFLLKSSHYNISTIRPKNLFTMAAVAAPLRMELVVGLDKPNTSYSTPAVTYGADIVYKALDSTLDCTRFIQIDPATSENDLIVCKLVHYSFRERPSFEALSYRKIYFLFSLILALISF